MSRILLDSRTSSFHLTAILSCPMLRPSKTLHSMRTFQPFKPFNAESILSFVEGLCSSGLLPSRPASEAGKGIGISPPLRGRMKEGDNGFNCLNKERL